MADDSLRDNGKIVASLNTQYTSLLLTEKVVMGTAKVFCRESQPQKTKSVEVMLPIPTLTLVVWKQLPFLERVWQWMLCGGMGVFSLFWGMKGDWVWGGICLVCTVIFAFILYYEGRTRRLHLRTATEAMVIPYKSWEHGDVVAFVQQVQMMMKGTSV